MKSEYVVLNNIQTHILTWGNPFHSGGKDVIVCITGNPGITDYYIEFASELYKTTGLPLCVIGQAGHEIVPDKKSNDLAGQANLFNLEGQILHKLDLINHYIDNECRLHLIGHSIGAWLILEILKDNSSLTNRLSSVNLLFPTLQRMAETRNGKYLNSLLRRFHVIVVFLLQLLYLLPAIVYNLLGEMYLRFYSLPLHHLDRTLKFANPKVIEKILFLAYNEMDIVRILNMNVLDSIKHLTNVLYSNRDNWAPVHYMDDLRGFQPQMCLKELDVDHAFVLKSSELVAEIVSDFIKTKLKK